jgi:signal transduction histidine kinase
VKLFRIAAAFGALTAAAAAAAFIGTEFVMAPSGGEQNRLISMYAAIAAAVFVVGLSLAVLTRRSLNRRILAVSIAGPLVVGLTTIWGAASMFTSSHDAQFVVILTALATALAALLVNLLSSPLLRDLSRISEVAKILGEGDLSARTGIDRSDELAYTFDSMANKIEQAASERKRLEDERQFMLSSLSHDARTPLTAIRAAVEALQDGMAPDPVRYLESIEHDLRSIEAIVEDLFVIGKLDADQLSLPIEELDLAEVAEIAVRAIKPLALKYDGPGFDADFVDRAFQQLERADAARTRAHGGAGLGLAVVRGLAEAQGGRVWADAGPGGRVTFELPAGV